MGHTALILGDQLSHSNPALEGADRVLMIESRVALDRLRYHRQRRHLVLSSMRHFAAELLDRGELEVVERRDVGSMADVLGDFDDVVCAEPNSLHARKPLEHRGVSFVPSRQFLTAPEDFAAWADGRRKLVMEDFYREQRRRFGLLLDERGKPEGGRWNLDKENRTPARDGLTAPVPWLPEEDEIDAEVRRDLDAMGLVEAGQDGPRLWPATGAEARIALDDFVANRLAGFGPWQDAMVSGERWLYHARLSSSLNLWLLDPLDACIAVQDAYRAGGVPLQSAEGFIRQIIGWREYIWGMYWLRGEDWRSDNALGAQRPLPEAFWTGETDAECLRSTLRDVSETAYAHHIQRLMVLGNLMLLLGVRPWEAVEWFQASFIDGAEWVMAPNAAGMATFADGGAMMTKPYAGGGNYIDKMSTYCRDCRYEPRSCPVTALYWDFMARHAEDFSSNRRMRLPLNTLGRMDPARLAALRQQADSWAAALCQVS
ncbi:MAG: cryptochrome/photolyase family protein [Solirubrobacterales bacterium]|nr:cryptochrome/photolyase family protein [Solirubrobacterales bacterium]